jgi:helicase
VILWKGVDFHKTYKYPVNEPKMMSSILSIKQPYSTDTVNLALDTIEISKQAFIFVNSKRSAEKTAEDIATKIKNVSLNKLSDEVLKALPKPTKQCRRLAYCVQKGVAFHHAGLCAEQRELIEQNFRKGIIKIIACTPTLAIGVDLPAYRTIIRDVKRYGGRWGMMFIPVLEYNQMAGRAGRPNYDNSGQSILIANTESEKEILIENYIHGEVEPIYSKLAVEPVLRTYTLSLLSTEIVNDTKSLLDFFEKTFWAHQYKDMEKIHDLLTKVVASLQKWRFINRSIHLESSGINTTDEELFDRKCIDRITLDAKHDDVLDEFTVASELITKPGIDKLSATPLGQKVSQLYLDPFTAHYFIQCIKRAKERILSPFSFLQMISYTLEMQPRLRVKTTDYEEVNQRLLKAGSDLYSLEPSVYESEYDDFLNSVKTAMFMEDWIEETDEDALMVKYDVRPGEIRYKLNIADWLLYACSELARVTKNLRINREIVKLRKRLSYGVKEELLALLQLKNIGRVRARKLFRNRIKNLGDVKKATMSQLTVILGKGVAADIKAQLGQQATEINVGRTANGLEKWV